jgi:hypothetical protein
MSANVVRPESFPRRDAVLLPLEAAARGFKSSLAFKRWCRRHNVPIARDEKLLWVEPADVDAAYARIRSGTLRAPVTVSEVDLNALAARSVAGLLGGNR